MRVSRCQPGMIVITGSFPIPMDILHPTTLSHGPTTVNCPLVSFELAGAGEYAVSFITFHDVSVFTIFSYAEFPWTMKAVFMENWAHGFNSPKFQTSAARTFFPALRNSAISMVSKYQCSRSARAGPKQTAFRLQKDGICYRQKC